MSFLNIKKASRAGAKTVFGLAGVSGGGKTHTAILLAYGLANRKADKVGFLDTENGRGLLSADILPNKEQFEHADFPPPFSPSRYIQAIRQFEKAGVEVLVVDSLSHEWEGEGGCEDIAKEGNPKTPRWNLAKSEHKKFMNALLQSSMHIILCIRARPKVKLQKNIRGELEFLDQGLQPVCEKNTMFELTGSLLVEDEGKSQVALKCPAALRDIFGRGKGYLNVEDGEAIRRWIDGGAPVDRALESERSKMTAEAEKGLKALEAAWLALSKPMQKKLAGDKEGWKQSAIAYDKQREISKGGDTSDEADAVNSALEGGESEGASHGDGSDIYRTHNA